MNIADWAVSVMEALGSIGAGLLVLLENLFPPIPSEVILPLAGFAASRGDLNVAAAVAATTAGSVIGALLLYGIGATVGLERVRRVADKLPLINLEDVDKTVAWFDRHGGKAVFFGRMIPIFRSLISLPAGVDRMPVAKFTALTAAGSAIWNAIFVLSGYFLGENWHAVEQYVGVFQWIVIAVVLIFVLWWVIRRVRRIGRA